MNASILNHAAALLQSFAIESVPFDRLVESYFRRHRSLHSRERRSIAELAFGVMRWRRRLEAEARAEGVRAPRQKDVVTRYEQWLQSASVPATHTMPADYRGGPAVFWAFPDWWCAAFVRDYGAARAAALMAACNRAAPTVLRANTLKIDRAELQERLAREGVVTAPTAWAPDGLVVEKRASFAARASFRAGLFEVQDEASQLAARCIPVREGVRVLDACAGAGGKTLVLAALMRNRGEIVAYDTDARKLAVLKERARRAGATVIRAVSSAEAMRRACARGAFDIVVIDAPCSGSGTLRRSPDLKWRLSEDDVTAHAVHQRALLDEYAARCTPTGCVVYITCSLFRAENENVVVPWMSVAGYVPVKTGEITAHGVPLSFITPEGFFSVTPVAAMDGFFAAALCKR